MTLAHLDVTAQLAVLRKCYVFSTLSQEALGVLAEMLRVEGFSEGEVVCQLGEPAGEIYVIADGELSVQLPGPLQPTRTLRAGDLLGEYGMFGDKVRTATVAARTDVILLSLDFDRFRKFLLEFPESAMALLEVAVERMVENIHSSGAAS